MFEKYAALRAHYGDDPEALQTIEAEEKRVTELLKGRAYAELEETQALLAVCRSQIVEARRKLATDRALSEAARNELWNLIDARKWFVEAVAKDYESELVQIEQQLDADLSIL